MALILDTCGILALAGLVRKKLSTDTLRRISAEDTVYVSACSLFELSIKHRKQSLDLGIFPDAAEFWQKVLKEYDLTDLPVSSALFSLAVNLPQHHNDPFDRIIVANALTHNATIVSFDEIFSKYGVITIS